MVWEYTDTMVDDNNWLEGQVEVRANYYDDVPQNYTVSLHKHIFCLLNISVCPVSAPLGCCEWNNKSGLGDC